MYKICTCYYIRTYIAMHVNTVHKYDNLQQIKLKGLLKNLVNYESSHAHTYIRT